MLVKRFKIKQSRDKGGWNWIAESVDERYGLRRSFTAVGKTLADVKGFVALVRRCERAGTLERLSEMHPEGFEGRTQTTWGGRWFVHQGRGRG